MTSVNDTPTGGFRKSLHGYNAAEVDDYVRKINGRLENLLTQVQAESSRADQSKRLLEQMTVELETTRRRAAEAEKREATALESQQKSEEDNSRLVGELKEIRERARLELEHALADAREERDTLMSEEREDAEAALAEARRAAAIQVTALQQEAANLSAELDKLRAISADTRYGESGHSELIETTAAQRIRIEAEVEAQRVYARSQIELVVAEVRRSAEEASARAIAAHRDQQERVRAMADECEALIVRIRTAIETHLGQVQAMPARAGANGTRSAVHGEASDDKRIRDSREWRSGEWRNAS